MTICLFIALLHHNGQKPKPWIWYLWQLRLQDMFVWLETQHTKETCKRCLMNVIKITFIITCIVLMELIPCWQTINYFYSLVPLFKLFSCYYMFNFFLYHVVPYKLCMSLSNFDGHLSSAAGFTNFLIAFLFCLQNCHHYSLKRHFGCLDSVVCAYLLSRIFNHVVIWAWCDAVILILITSTAPIASSIWTKRNNIQ